MSCFTAADTEADIMAAIAVTNHPDLRCHMKISTEVTIPASLSAVWGLLVDFPRYRSWHPFVEIAGQAREGAEIDYFYRNKVEAPSGMSIRATILRLQPMREIRLWMGFKGIATLEEWYRLERVGTQVLVVHAGTATGVIPIVSAPLIRNRLTQKFQLPLDWLARHLTSAQTPKTGRKP